MLPDMDGCIRLLAAVVRLWLRDAGDDPREWAMIATFLGITPLQLRERVEGYAALARAGVSCRQCPGCGAPLPEYNASEHGSGQRRLYCDERCRRRAANLRAKERNHAAI